MPAKPKFLPIKCALFLPPDVHPELPAAEIETRDPMVSVLLAIESQVKSLAESLGRIETRLLIRSDFVENAACRSSVIPDNLPHVMQGVVELAAPVDGSAVSERQTSSHEGFPASVTEVCDGKRKFASAMLSAFQAWSHPVSRQRSSSEGLSPAPYRMLSRQKTGDVSLDHNAVFFIRWFQMFVMTPVSMQRFWWDVCSAVIVGYDMFMLPFLAFSPARTLFTVFVAWLMALFWSFDIPRQFLSGFYRECVIEMRPSKIALRYLRSTFVFDVSLVILDWVFIVLEEKVEGQPTSSSPFVRLVRVFRAFRIFRLMRLSRLVLIFRELTDMVNRAGSQVARLTFQICLPVLMILSIAHCIACAWYAVGKVDYSGASFIDSTDLDDRTLWYRYSSCLHWVLAQFTPGTMEIHPENTVERIFAICVVLSGLILFSSLISSISGSFAQLRELRRAWYDENRYLNAFFVQHKISVVLAKHILLCAKAQRFKKKSVHEADVESFAVLPWTVRQQLHREMYAPSVASHPFLSCLQQIEAQILLDICHLAMAQGSFQQGEEVFTSGVRASHASYISSGKLHYWHIHDRLGNYAVVDGSEWLSQTALWMPWRHHGTLNAIASVELVNLDGARFAESISSSSPQTWELVSDFAMAFVRQVCGPDGAGDDEWLTDLLRDSNLQCLCKLIEKTCGDILVTPFQSRSSASSTRSRLSQILLGIGFAERSWFQNLFPLLRRQLVGS